MMKILLWPGVVIAMIGLVLSIGCAETATPEPATVEVATQSPVIITVVVSPTPGPTVEATQSPTATATVVLVQLPTPTQVPATVEPTPAPTATPWVIRETVVVPVTVVVTATATIAPTSTPTPTPTPTATPVPTATPIPPFIQQSAGKGSWLSGPFTFWAERPIEIDINVRGSGSFALNAVTLNGCIIQLSSGAAPYTGRTLAVPSTPEVCDGMNEFGNGTQLSVIAGSNVNWSVDLTQYSQAATQNPPFVVSGTGQNILGPVRLGQGEVIGVQSAGLTPFTLHVYSVFDLDPFVSRIISVPASAHGIWFQAVPIGAYMIAINTEPGREWTVDIHNQ